jgi:DNA-binding NarL/FixJ family response regulator
VDAAAVAFGIGWLVAELAADAPLVLLVDDAHWVDRASLDVVAFLARRVGDLPVLLVVATRPVADVTPLRVLETLAHTRVVRPDVLSADEVGALVAETFGTDPTAAFVSACVRATGGNPFYVGELCHEIAARGLGPDDRAAADIDTVRPDAVLHSVTARIGSLPESARSTARALSILGDGVELVDLAALAGLDVETAAAAIDVLSAAAVLAPGLPPRFLHPLVRDVVYDDQPPASRAAAHARAAGLLAASGADPERVAMQLLRAPVERDPARVEILRRAARAARGRGDNRTAVEHLRRAIAEAGVASPELERELGFAQLAAGDGEAVTTLTSALERADDASRSRVALALSNALTYAGRYDDAVTALRDVLAVSGAGADACDVATSLLAAQRATGRPKAELDDVLDRLIADSPDGPAKHRLVAARAAAGARDDVDERLWLPDVVRWVDDAMEGTGGTKSAARSMVVIALTRAAAFDEADRAVERWLLDAERSGSLLDLMTAETYGANVAMTRGHVLDAEARAAAALRLAATGGWFNPLAMSLLGGALAEQARLDDGRQVLADAIPDTADLPPAFAPLIGARGRLQLAAGDASAALDDLVRAYDASGSALWARHVVAAMLKVGRADDALTFARAHLARTDGGVTAIARLARREVAVATPGAEGIELLAASAEEMRTSPMVLERAYTLLVLGAALRRARRPKEARAPLTDALDLAHRCGAWLLEQHARDELHAAGARPRRSARIGVAALTASERRVADLAAAGHSNPDIARSLYISRKSVETHLSHVYQKLGIAGRADLREAMAADAP